MISKIFFPLVALTLIFSETFSQNLVPNPGFEQYSTCPSNDNQLDRCLYWINPSIQGFSVPGTPDYFNQCANAFVDIPYNYAGFQLAHGGGAYMGIVLSYAASLYNFREYVEVQLTSPLVAGECYHFEFYGSMADNMKYTSGAVGAYFSDTLVDSISNYYPLPFTPQLSNASGNVFDTLSWTQVSGDYVATGGENFLIIGNFKDDAHTTTSLVNSGAMYSGVYIYIDDISLVHVTCHTGTGEPVSKRGLKIFPNPIHDEMYIESASELPSEFILYDMTMRKVLQREFSVAVSIPAAELAKGIYLYEVRSSDGSIHSGKVVKQ